MLRSLGTTTVSSLLQNIPAPAGRNLDTFPTDYEHERFFLLPVEDASGLGRAPHRDAIFRLHDTLDTRLRELGEGYIIASTDSLFMSDVTIAKSLSQAMSSWVYVDLPAYVLPLQFSVLQTHVPQDVLHFCFRQGILEYLPPAMDLIEKSFPSIQGLHLEQEQDPETGEEWLTINFTLRGQVNEILDSYDKYTDEWVSLVPWPEREKVRIAYNVI